MSNKEPGVRALQRAKRGLLKKYEHCDWFSGVGIAPTKNGLGLRLNVDPGADLKKQDIPDTYHRIPIEIVRISGYKARKPERKCDS